MQQVDRLRPRIRTNSWFGDLIHTLVFVLVVTVLFDMVIPRSLVDGSSMRPNFDNDQRLIVSRVHYFVHPPQRGEVLVFNSLNAFEPGVMLIKRVIGLPGETVEIRDTEVYVNGERLEEPYIQEPCDSFHCKDNVWDLGPNEYFVMGDNRNVSKDSRAFGPVTFDHIVGEVLFRYWPPTDWGFITAASYD